MKQFTYIAIDPQGLAVRGTVTAADWPAAEAQLLAQGLNGCQPAGNGAPRTTVALLKLRKAEAIELVIYLSELAKAGLPLGSTLKAAGRGAHPARLTRALQAIDRRLQDGQSLDEVLRAVGAGTSPLLQEFLAGTLTSPEPAAALAALLTHQREIDDLSRRFWQAVLYPAVLLVLLVGWLLMMSQWIAPLIGDSRQFVEDNLETNGRLVNGLEEFGRLTPPAILGTAAIGGLLVLVTALVGGRAALGRMLMYVPLLGPAWQYRALADFSGLLSMILQRQLKLDHALRLAGSALHDPTLGAACPQAAEGVAGGSTLSTVLATRALFPPTLVNLVCWGEEHDALAEALSSARRMFIDRFELQLRVVRVVWPTIVFLLVGLSVLLCFHGLTTAIRLIQALL